MSLPFLFSLPQPKLMIVLVSMRATLSRRYCLQMFSNNIELNIGVLVTIVQPMSRYALNFITAFSGFVCRQPFQFIATVEMAKAFCLENVFCKS